MVFYVNHKLALCSIEHLQLEDVDRFTEVVFGYMAPVAAIISTPNADFNPLLPGLTGFRHYDHKFEWTKVEFQTWYVYITMQSVCLYYNHHSKKVYISYLYLVCTHPLHLSHPSCSPRALKVCREFGYVVAFTGVGQIPDQEESIGFCSQIGVFQIDRSGGDAPRLQNNVAEEHLPYRVVRRHKWDLLLLFNPVSLPV